ncbi:hypothetical protein B0H11DRAFT_1913414 [Mycena galericulata]|nr:hypothetical protein B0H11DRAFT_1913414 [Mycena galericulata]
MESLCSAFTFACTLPAAPTAGTISPTSSAPLFTSFSTSPTKPVPNHRAETQARYRARHKESEQAKARERMRRLRVTRKEVDVSSEDLRARRSAVFARYRVYLRKHTVKIWTDHDNVEQWNAAWQRFCDKEGPPFDRQDAVFLLRHDHPNPNPGSWPTDEEIDRRLQKLNNCDVVLAYADDEVDDWRDVLSRTPVGSTDDDLEWLFRHTIPTPTIENTCSSKLLHRILENKVAAVHAFSLNQDLTRQKRGIGVRAGVQTRLRALGDALRVLGAAREVGEGRMGGTTAEIKGSRGGGARRGADQWRGASRDEGVDGVHVVKVDGAVTIFFVACRLACLALCASAMKVLPVGAGVEDGGFLRALGGGHGESLRSRLGNPSTTLNSRASRINWTSVKIEWSLTVNKMNVNRNANRTLIHHLDPNSNMPSSSVISNQPSGMLFTTFTAGGTSASQPSARAKAQARYRAKNRQREQNKSRERMSRLREARREGGEEELQRKASSEKLRATQHAQKHIVPFLIEQEGEGEPEGAEGPIVEAIGRDLLPDEVVACRGNFRLVLSITDACTVASFDKMLAAGKDLDDDDLEFMIRHQVPVPTLENLACCVHHSTLRAIALAEEAHQLRVSGEPFVPWVLDRTRATAGNPKLRLRSGAQYFSPAVEIYVRTRRKMLMMRFRLERQWKMGVGHRNQKQLEAEWRACVFRARTGGGDGRN